MKEAALLAQCRLGADLFSGRDPDFIEPGAEAWYRNPAVWSRPEPEEFPTASGSVPYRSAPESSEQCQRVESRKCRLF